MPSFFDKRRALRHEAEQLVQLIRSEVPVGQEHLLLGDRALPKKSAAVLRGVAGKARAFALEHRTGMLGRAYLAHRIRWGLGDLGYSESFVEAVTASIVLAMAQSSRPVRPANS